MNMEDFHCDMLNVAFSFEPGAFDKSAFMKEADIQDEDEYRDEDGDLIFRSFLPSKKDVKKLHSHLRILIKPDTSGRINLDFHQPGVKEIEKKPPYLEDAAKWLSKFLAKKNFPARLNVVYEFDKTFETTIPLPFPLVASSKRLSGLKVSGLSLEYPSDSYVRTAIVQVQPSGPFLYLQVVTSINLATFGLYKELRKLEKATASLVRKRDGNGHEDNRQKAKRA